VTRGRSYKTDAVVLRGRPLGEADRILTLFTSERGKLDAVAKGVRRTKSHLAGRLEFGNECLLTLHRGRSLDVIVTSDILRAPWTGLVEPERFAVASLIAELIDAFCEPDLALPDIYELLVGAIGAVAVSAAPRSLVPRFSARLLAALGLEPPADHCVRCTRSFEERRAWVDPDAGGWICTRCRESWRDLVELDREDLENLRAVAAPRGDTRAAVAATPRVAQAIDALVVHQLGRRPKASLS